MAFFIDYNFTLPLRPLFFRVYDIRVIRLKPIYLKSCITGCTPDRLVKNVI